MSVVNHNFWSDGTPRSQNNAFSSCIRSSDPQETPSPRSPQLAYYYRKKEKAVISDSAQAQAMTDALMARMTKSILRNNVNHPFCPPMPTAADTAKTARLAGRSLSKRSE